MTFRQFAVNNVLRNKRLYAAYFLSSMFTVMVFFTFAIFAFHPVFADDSFSKEVVYGMAVSGGIIYVFSFFFVLYSMSSFLQSRKKEFGLFMIQGMSTRQIRLMIFMENMLIGVFATIGGILLGLVFAKFILLLAENILIINEALYFYVPWFAILLTLVSFIVLFMFISFFVSFVLRTKKLVHLMKADKTSKGEPRASMLLTGVATVLLLAGYGTALYVKGVQVIVAMVPVIIVVTIATYLLFTQCSVYIISRLKKNPYLFWKKTNMVLFSDLSFRMKDNARSFFMVAMISTVAFSAIGTLYGLQSFITTTLTNTTPYSVMYTPQEESPEEDVHLIQETMQEHSIKASQEEVNLRYFSVKDKKETIIPQAVLITKESDYNRMASLLKEETVQLSKDQVIAIKPYSQYITSEEKNYNIIDIPVTLGNGITLQPNKEIEPTHVLPEFSPHYIVSDAAYEKLPAPMVEEKLFAWSADKGQEEKLIQLGETLADKLNYDFTVQEYSLYQTNKMFGPILFIGLFIGIVFFVAAGSFLYFRLYTDLDEDKQKFQSIAKLGLTDKELRKIITRQIALLFFSPIVVAFIHGAVALTALSHMFHYNLVTESLIVLGVFAGIQVIYFAIVRHFYIKQIQDALH